MTSGSANVWIRSGDNELVRSDVIIGLRCHGGEVEAACPDGSVVRLAGPGCPPDFHLQLLRELGRLYIMRDDRWVVIVSSDVTPGSAMWIAERVDELARQRLRHQAQVTGVCDPATQEPRALRGSAVLQTPHRTRVACANSVMERNMRMHLRPSCRFRG